jgi:hypothetical protein
VTARVLRYAAGCPCPVWLGQPVHVTGAAGAGAVSN